MPSSTSGAAIAAAAAALLLLLAPSLAHAQSDDPCLEQLADDPDTLDQYDALVSDYLDASAASDAERQVEILDELLGVCDANLRLRVFRANANVTLARCEPALADYRFVLDNAETWPAADNAGDARAMAQDAMTRYTAACGDTGTTTTTTTTTDPDTTDPDTTDPDTTDPNSTDPNATDPNATDPNATDPSAEPTPSDMSIVIGGGPHGGVGWGKFGEDAEESVLGFGGGAQLFAVFHFVPLFGIGLNLNYGYWVHTNDDEDVEFAASVPSFGILARLAAGWFTANLSLNYFVGTLEASDVEDASDSLELELGGVEVVLAPMAHIGVSDAFGIEVGLFASVRSGKATFESDFFDPNVGVVSVDGEDDVLQLAVGAIVLAVYEIGL